MLYAGYQVVDDFLTPLRTAALYGMGFSRLALEPFVRFSHRSAAVWEMIARFRLTHARPPYGIASVFSGNSEVAVAEEVVLDLPFGNLVRFRRDMEAEQPKVLVVAPLSGHFATLLAGTVRTLLRDHDVYITDWKNARDVPLSVGRFGVEDYTAYIIRFLQALGPGCNVLAVCQPCVQTLAAVAVMSEDDDPATPRTMTLMAGPVDVRESPTMVNDLASDRPLDWFRRMVIARVPGRYGGAGRKVYPGFLQLTAFLQMNMARHRAQHQRMYDHLARGEVGEAMKIKEFYDEYFAVLDLTEEFYLETIDRVFQRAELASGTMTFRGRPVDPGKIRKTALLTVEGGRDDICGMGQTAAAHDLCSSLRPHLKRHHLQANVGHYGVFNGRRWENEIYPVMRNLIQAME